jgi:protein-disulfide isomerase
MFRASAAAMALCLTLAAPGGAQALDLAAMTEEESAAFGAAVREYLLENPQVIVEAVQALEDRQAAVQAEADIALVEENREAIFNDGYSYVGGNPDGDITLVEFLDYRCGYCKRAHPEVARLLDFDGNIRLIVKEFPILGDQSMLASRYAIATRQLAGPEIYKALSDTLMEFSGDITLPALHRIGEGLEIDPETLDAIEVQMMSDEVTAEIQQTRELAQKLEINGTPTFVLEDQLLRGYLPFDQMLLHVEDQRG